MILNYFQIYLFNTDLLETLKPFGMRLWFSMQLWLKDVMSTALYKIILGLRMPYYCSCKTIKSTQDIQTPLQSDTIKCFLSTHIVVDFCCCCC